MSTEGETFLHYKVFKWSSYSSYYVPEYVEKDKTEYSDITNEEDIIDHYNTLAK